MTLRKRSYQADEVAELVAELASPQPIERQFARDALITLKSREVTRALVVALYDPRQHVRWEAAKALAALADPLSAPALVEALEDESEDVRWLAAEGLIALGKKGVMEVLRALMKRAASVELCKSAHHVLRACKQGATGKTIEPVLAALSKSEPGVSVPPAAYTALMALEVGLLRKS